VISTRSQSHHSPTLIASGDFTTDHSDWQPYQSKAFALPNGFERVVIGIRVNGVDATQGHQVALDAVAFDAANEN
jgi:hypothetical protein